MANIIPVNQMIDRPDFLGAGQQGLQFGQQQRALREQRADKQQLRALAPQIIAGDPAAYAQAAAIDPLAANAQQGAGDSIARRAEGLVRLLEEADKRDPREAQALWQAHGVPFARQFSQGTEPTTDWAQAKPMLANLKARIEMAKSAQNPAADPTGFRELHMKALAAGYQPGTPEYQNAMRVGIGTEGRAATGGFGFEKVVGRDGRERMGRTNPRTGVFEVYDEASGNFTPLGGPAALNGGPAPAAGFDDGGGAVVGGTRVNMGLPPQVQESVAKGIAAMEAAGVERSVIDAFATSQMAQSADRPGAPSRPSNPALGVSQAPAEKAFATESGQQAAQLQYLPEQERIKRESSIQEATGKAEAEARIKREADLATAAQKKYVDATTTLSLLDEAEGLLDKSTGSRIGAARDATAAAFGHSTEGAQAIAALQPIAASLTLAVPRMEGPQSDADRLLYQKAAGDFANSNVPVETRKAAMGQMRRLANKYRQMGGTSSPGSIARPQSQSDFDALPSGATYIDPDDGKTYRKP